MAPCIYSSGLLYFYWPFVSDKTLIYGGGVFLTPATAGKEGSLFPQPQGGKCRFIYFFLFFFFFFRATPFQEAVTRLMPLSSRSDFRGHHSRALIDKRRKVNNKRPPSKEGDPPPGPRPPAPRFSDGNLSPCEEETADACKSPPHAPPKKNKKKQQTLCKWKGAIYYRDERYHLADVTDVGARLFAVAARGKTAPLPLAEFRALLWRLSHPEIPTNPVHAAIAFSVHSSDSLH